MAYDEELAERVRAALAERGAFDEKKMFGGICFLVNGNMTAGLTSRELMFRVGPNDFEATLEEPYVRPMTFTGKALKGFIYVDEEGVRTSKRLQAWIDRALAYVLTLPKKAKKKRGPARSANSKAVGASHGRSIKKSSVSSRKGPARK